MPKKPSKREIERALQGEEELPLKYCFPLPSQIAFHSRSQIAFGNALWPGYAWRDERGVP